MSSLPPEPSVDVPQLSEKISALSELPVNEHVDAYEEIHRDLQRALSEIEGL